MKKAGSGAGFGSESESGSVSQWYGSADPNSDQDVRTIIKMKLKLSFFLFFYSVHFCLLGPDVTQTNPYLVEFRIHYTVQSAVHCLSAVRGGGGRRILLSKNFRPVVADSQHLMRSRIWIRIRI
jgi:hypothetical protein